MRKWMTIACLFFSSALMAQKIAAVRLDSVMQFLPEYQVAEFRYDSITQLYEDSLLMLSRALEQKMNPGCFREWTAQEKKYYELELQRLQEYFQQLQARAQEQLTAFSEKLNASLKNKARAWCVMVARQNGYTVLIDVSEYDPVLHGDIQPADITAEVIARIK